MMKFIDEALITEDLVFPAFFKEGWIADAIKELDLVAMSPEQRYHYEKDLAQAASEYYHYQEEMEKIREEERELAQQQIELERQIAREEERKIAQQKIEQEKEIAQQKIEQEKEIAQQKIEQEKEIAQQKIEQEKESAILQLLDLKVLSNEQIAKIQNVPLEKVLELEQKLESSDKKKFR